MLEDVAVHLTAPFSRRGKKTRYQTPYFPRQSMGGQLAVKVLTGLGLIWQIVLRGGQITRNPYKAVTLHFDVFNVWGFGFGFFLKPVL